VCISLSKQSLKFSTLVQRFATIVRKSEGRAASSIRGVLPERTGCSSEKQSSSQIRPRKCKGIVGVGGVSSIGGVGVGSLMAAASMTAGAAASAGSAVMAGATSAAGGASALKAAFQSAQQHAAEGAGNFSGSGGSGSGAIGGSSGGASSSSGGSGSFGSFMSNAGRFAADMGGSLANGASQVAKEKAASMMDSAKERIGQTTGGRIASAIRGGSDYRDSAGADTASFAGDSLGAGNVRRQQNPMNDEVAAFVNQDRSSREET